MDILDFSAVNVIGFVMMIAAYMAVFAWIQEVRGCKNSIWVFATVLTVFTWVQVASKFMRHNGG